MSAIYSFLKNLRYRVQTDTYKQW